MEQQSAATANMRLSVPFLHVTDMDRSLKFYVDQLGFNIQIDWQPRGRIEWCWLGRDEVAFMLQQPEYNTHEVYSIDRKGYGISINIQCNDSISLYHEFTGKEVLTSELFVGNSLWTFHVKDPDGYHIEFASITDVPEGTTYSQWMNQNYNS